LIYVSENMLGLVKGLEKRLHVQENQMLDIMLLMGLMPDKESKVH